MTTHNQPDWRSKIGVAESVEHLYNEKVMSDVKFLFKDKEPFKAHKVILGMRSAVFEAMFYGTMSGKNDEVLITDIDRDIFDMMLRFVYTNKVEVDGENVLKCLNAGKKYCIDGLIQLCENFLEHSISVDNVCSIYEQAKFFELKDLVKKCKNFIADNSVDVVENEDFSKLSQESLKDFLANQDNKNAEITFFKAAINWAEAKCKQKRIEPTPSNKRSELGDAINEIRFALMTHVEFAKIVAPTQLLTNDELGQMYLWIILKDWPSEDILYTFPSLPRGDQEICVDAQDSEDTENVTMIDKIIITIYASHNVQIISFDTELTVEIKSVQLRVKAKENTGSGDTEQKNITADVNKCGGKMQFNKLSLDPQHIYTLTFQLKQMSRSHYIEGNRRHCPSVETRYSSVTYEHFKPSDKRYVCGGVYIQLTDIVPRILKTIRYKCKTTDLK